MVVDGVRFCEKEKMRRTVPLLISLCCSVLCGVVGVLCDYVGDVLSCCVLCKKPRKKQGTAARCGT